MQNIHIYYVNVCGNELLDGCCLLGKLYVAIS